LYLAGPLAALTFVLRLDFPRRRRRTGLLLGRDGNALVLASGARLSVLAKNWLDDGFDASPVFSGKEVYLADSTTCRRSPGISAGAR
jgi:hypothetical protein